MNLGSRLQRPCSELICSVGSSAKEEGVVFTWGTGETIYKGFIEETLELSLER